MSKIKAVSFDLDHTLYDRNATWDALLPVFRRIYSCDITDGTTDEALLTALKAADYKGTYEETSWPGMYAELVKQHIISQAHGFTCFNRFIFDYFPSAIVPYPDTYSTLAWCRRKGLHPSVITNGHPKLQERKLTAMNLRPYLDECIVCNLDSGAGCKPEPDAFWELASRLALEPAEILYVGDNPRNDIMGARRAGMRTAWLNVMDNWCSGYERADFEISFLRELPDIISEINEI